MLILHLTGPLLKKHDESSISFSCKALFNNQTDDWGKWSFTDYKIKYWPPPKVIPILLWSSFTLEGKISQMELNLLMVK